MTALWLPLLALLLMASPNASAQQSAPFPFDPSAPREYVPDDAPKPPFVSSARRLLTAPELPDAPDTWIANSLDWVDFVLQHYRPALREHPVHTAALIRMDDILHIPAAPKKALVQEFYNRRLENALKEIESTKITEGLRVWKLYNHGFVVRTASVTFAFDIVPGTREPGFRVPAAWIERIAKQCDALFISHLHGDHANREVARAFLALGKPVVAPEGLWNEEPEFAKALTYPARNTGPAQELALAGGRHLNVVAYPGHQGARVLVNVHLVTTPEGFTVVHTGDQFGPDEPGSDFDWISQIDRDHNVDVLMPNCWTFGMGRMVRGVNPKLVIPGHENEMGHTVDHREDYTQTFTRMYPVNYPVLFMTWGESYHYRKP